MKKSLHALAAAAALALGLALVPTAALAAGAETDGILVTLSQPGAGEISLLSDARSTLDDAGLAAGDVVSADDGTLTLEARPADGQTDEQALAAALDAVEAASDAGEAAASPLWDHVAGYLDPSRSGEAWAAHKQQQGEALRESMRRGIAEQALSPAWRACAGDDARYRHIVEVAKQLARTPAPHREG